MLIPIYIVLVRLKPKLNISLLMKKLCCVQKKNYVYYIYIFF